MAQHRRYTTCGKCDDYSYALKRCKLASKVNPPTLKGTVSAMETMGASYICEKCRWKAKAFRTICEKNPEGRRRT